jgi:type VI secretion system protein ImpM
VPGKHLTGTAGLYGKLPTAGDFVARGLPPKLRHRLDRWLTATLAGPTCDWPPEGFRALLPGPHGVATLLILPSADRAGRAFPLAAVCTTAEAPALAAAEAWCAAAVPFLRRGTEGVAGPDALVEALSLLPAPEGPPHPVEGPLLWRPGEFGAEERDLPLRG